MEGTGEHPAIWQVFRNFLPRCAVLEVGCEIWTFWILN